MMNKNRDIFYKILYERPYYGTNPVVLYNSAKNSKYLLQRFRCLHTLNAHNGCVNTICWNNNGQYILSGSDDLHLSITDAYTGEIKTKIRTGHMTNIFSAKYLPCTDDMKIVSCSGDGVIIYTDLNRPETTYQNIFDCHDESVYDLVTVPNDPHTFLSCSHDNTVRWYDLRVKQSCQKHRIGHRPKCRDDVLLHCEYPVTAIAINHLLPWQLAIGCSDSIIRIYDRRMLTTKSLRGNGSTISEQNASIIAKFTYNGLNGHNRITSLSYSKNCQQLLASYSNDNLYLFNLHDVHNTIRIGNEDDIIKQDQLNKHQQPPYKRFRLRGDWSDTGPSALTSEELRNLNNNNNNSQSSEQSATESSSSSTTTTTTTNTNTNSSNQQSASLNTNERFNRQLNAILSILFRNTTSPITSSNEQDNDDDEETATRNSSTNNLSTQATNNSSSSSTTSASTSSNDSEQNTTTTANNETIREQRSMNNNNNNDNNHSESSSDNSLNYFIQIFDGEDDDDDDDDDDIDDNDDNVIGGGRHHDHDDDDDDNDNDAYSSYRNRNVNNNNNNMDDDYEFDSDTTSDSVFFHDTSSSSIGSRSNANANNTNANNNNTSSMNDDSRRKTNSNHNKSRKPKNKNNSNKDLLNDTIMKRTRTFKIKNFKKFTGHRNSRTVIKEATFWGDDFIISGSDCGHIFFWSIETGEVVMIMEGDHHVVNCLQPHPTDPILASSGIDYNIKIWGAESDDCLFDLEKAKKLINRNKHLLEETRDTGRVPARFVINLFTAFQQRQQRMREQILRQSILDRLQHRNEHNQHQQQQQSNNNNNNNNNSNNEMNIGHDHHDNDDNFNDDI